MQHRITLFANITLPSIMAQTCQNFTWLILMDTNTPKQYSDFLTSFKYHNFKIIYVDGNGMDNKLIADAILKNIELGEYDLITTRIDNDDAFNFETIQKIQDWYAPRPDRWMISFPLGVTMDIRTRQIFPIQYLFNHFPTLIENSINAKTVFCWPHYDIKVDVKEFIVNDFFWLQIIHSQNVDSSMKDRPSIEIMKDKPLSPEILKKFSLNPDKLLNTDFEAHFRSNTIPA